MTLGLLISIDPAANPESVRIALQARSEILSGERADRWLPVAVQTENDAECREIHDWISKLPGVAFVDVVHVNFESASASEEMPENSAKASVSP